jgi:hypothetical protein
VTQEFTESYLKQARKCLYIDTLIIMSMMVFYLMGTPSTNQYEREIGVSDVGNSRYLVLAYAPFLVL